MPDNFSGPAISWSWSCRPGPGAPGTGVSPGQLRNTLYSALPAHGTHGIARTRHPCHGRHHAVRKRAPPSHEVTRSRVCSLADIAADELLTSR